MIVFTNGCFDLLHAGHLHHLSQARAFGTRLIVGLNSDASVRRLKGPGRPNQSERVRAASLWALPLVGLVQIFDANSPEELVRWIKPDVYACGPDHDPQRWWPVVAAWGGVVLQTKELPGVRTTSVMEGKRCAS